MQAIIMPGFSELIIKINPLQNVTREKLISVGMPWLYAPWPKAQTKGIIVINFKGSTLRDLLNTLAHKYQKASVDFVPINPKTNDVDFDYNVLVNDRNYAYMPEKLDLRLKEDDEVKIKVFWRWDG